MSDGKDAKARLRAYIDCLASGDVDAVVGLYAENATCEDPVGGKRYTGLAEIRDFYEVALRGQGLRIEPVTPLISTTTNYAAMGAKAKTRHGVIHFVETQLYDDAGKIIEMRAYYDPADIQPD
jgi:steroid delta-isomerase